MNELTEITVKGATTYSCGDCGFNYEWNDSDLARKVATQLHEFHHTNLDASMVNDN